MEIRPFNLTVSQKFVFDFFDGVLGAFANGPNGVLLFERLGEIWISEESYIACFRTTLIMDLEVQLRCKTMIEQNEHQMNFGEEVQNEAFLLRDQISSMNQPTHTILVNSHLFDESQKVWEIVL